MYYTPITMKKNRPAIQLTIICKVNDKHHIENVVLNHTSSLGVRSYTVNRRILSRAFRKINTQYGDITIKFSLKNGKILKMKPEYEEMKKVSVEETIPLQNVYNEVMKALYNNYKVGDELTEE